MDGTFRLAATSPGRAALAGGGARPSSLPCPDEHALVRLAVPVVRLGAPP
ncbi:hypothetical protein [Streptomyces sp. P17]|nr:hypothetical protein [Streptomyces sp. P17]MDT9696990.1 hypothetical protein [Streptomyces sp. P17]